MTLSISLALAALITTIVTWAEYLSTVPRGKVPIRPIGGIILQLTALGLAAAALITSARAGSSPDALVIAPAGVAVTMSALFLFILTQRKTPIGKITVSVGDVLPSFSAMTSEGVQLSSEAFAGQRTMLKFFRGGW